MVINTVIKLCNDFAELRAIGFKFMKLLCKRKAPVSWFQTYKKEINIFQLHRSKIHWSLHYWSSQIYLFLFSLIPKTICCFLSISHENFNAALLMSTWCQNSQMSVLIKLRHHPLNQHMDLCINNGQHGRIWLNNVQ